MHIHNLWINSSGKGQNYDNLPLADRTIDETLQAAGEVNPEWTSMVVTIVRVPGRSPAGRVREE